MTQTVTVIDYGVGNLHSVVKALRHEGAEAKVTSSPKDLRTAERVVLPGVGAFGDGMRELHGRHLVEPIRRYVETGRPFLGICLGMQLLLSESEEFGHHGGLGIIRGRVVAIPSSPGVKVPQIGWNWILPRPGGDWASSILEDAAPRTMVYFVHSFTAVPGAEEHRLADAYYGETRISAAIQANNVIGCQFHPEKSGPVGLSMIRRFLAIRK
jgi:glutamine amidotransferase